MQTWMTGLMLAALPWLTACDKLKNTPVAVGGTPLPGYWLGEQRDAAFHDRLFLHVSDAGHVRYVFLSCDHRDGMNSEKRLDLHDMPVIRLTTKKMVLQMFPLTPKFELTLGAWPDENGDVWVVDEMPLRRIDADAVPVVEAWGCG